MIGGDKRAAAIALKALAAESQAWYCQEATRRIDALRLRGTRYEDEYLENGTQADINEDGLTQTLEFPRVIDGVVLGWDYQTELPLVPERVKRACLEEAIALYKYVDSFRLEAQQRGVKAIDLGDGLSEQYLPGAGEGLLSSEARALMSRYVIHGLEMV
jgi:hypothetical protein